MKALLILIAALLFAYGNAFAGAEGHGGGTYVCRSQKGSILDRPLSVEVLDLWEASVLFNLDIPRSDRPWLGQANAALDKLARWQPYLASALPEDMSSHLRDIPEGTIISPPQDVRSHLAKKGCSLEGAASYNDQNDFVYLDREITSAMSPTDFAALIVHEMVYKAFRELYGDQNSVRARRVVGFLFSDLPVPGYAIGVPQKARYCETASKDYAFYLYEEKEQVFIQLERVADQPVLALTRGVVSTVANTKGYIRSLLDGSLQKLRIADKAVHLPSRMVIATSKAESFYETFRLTFTEDEKHSEFMCRPR